MPSNKDRLYVALYARGGRPTMPNLEDTYHWGLLIGPKKEPDGGQGKRYHAKEKMTSSGQSEWSFEEREVPLAATNMLLVRIVIAKIVNREQVENILRSVPVRQGTEGWNCVAWVKEALELLTDDDTALGTNVTVWRKVRDAAMSYCQRKKEDHRFDGKGNFDMTKAPTYDLIIGEEIIS